MTTLTTATNRVVPPPVVLTPSNSSSLTNPVRPRIRHEVAPEEVADEARAEDNPSSKESATMIDRNNSKYNPSPIIIKKKPPSPRSTTPPSYRSYDDSSTNKRLLAKQRKMSTSSEDDSSGAKTATASFKGEWIIKDNAKPNLSAAPPARPPKTSESNYTDSSARSRSRRRSPSSSSSDQSPPPPPRPLKSAPVNYSAVDVASNRRSFMNDPRNQVLPTGGLVRMQETTTTTEYASIMSSSKVV